MSSILDALNKLEEDKALAQSTPEGSEDLDPDSVGEELVGRSVLRDRITLRFSPLTLIVGGLVATVVVVSFSVAASLLVVRLSGPVEERSVDTGLEEASTAMAVETPNISLVESAGIVDAGKRIIPAEEGPAVTEAAPEATRPEPAREPEHLIVAPMEVSGEPEARTEPAGENAPERPQEEQAAEPAAGLVEALPAESALESERVAMLPEADVEALAPSRSEEVDAPADPSSAVLSLTELPILTQGDWARYSEGPFMINMVHPKSDTNPYGHAVINVIKVYEGQNIPGTQFKLIGLDMDGIGVAVQGTTKRFFIPF